MEGQSSTPKVIVFGLVFVLLNLLLLDFFFIENEFLSPKSLPSTSQNVVPLVSPSKETTLCPNDCIERIYESTSSLKLIEPTSEQKQKKQEVLVSDSGVKEFFVPFGSGINTSEDWSDVTGLASYVDTTKYGRIKEIRFEASVLIPHGNQMVYVRLYNVSDKQAVWNSEMMHEGGESKLLVSPSLQLPSGNKLYQVQMKSQLKGPTNLNQSRLHITVY